MGHSRDWIRGLIHRGLWRRGLVYRVGAQTRFRALRGLPNHRRSARAGVGRGSDWKVANTNNSNRAPASRVMQKKSRPGIESVTKLTLCGSQLESSFKTAAPEGRSRLAQRFQRWEKSEEGSKSRRDDRV